jgi:hypothetical protein
MTKTLILQLIAGCFILGLPACVDHRYDLDDDKVDKNAVFSPGGINIPVGQIEKISIEKELRKPYDNIINQIKVDETGLLYIEYDGEFPFVLPNFQAPAIPPMQIGPFSINMGDIPGGTTILPEGGYPLSEETYLTMAIDPPVFNNASQTLQIDVEKINFSGINFNLDLTVSGVRLGEGDAEILVLLKYPDNFVLEDPVPYFLKTIPVHPTDSDVFSCTISDLGNILAYDYLANPSDLVYQLVLMVNTTLEVTIPGSAPAFTLILSPAGNPQVESLECNIEGVETISGAIPIDDFQEAYSGYIFDFKNPLLEFSLETNLGSNFSTGITVSSDLGSASLAAADRLEFQKPAGEYPDTRTTAYTLSPENPDNLPNWKLFPMNDVFNTVPSYANYDFSLQFDDRVVLYPGGAQLNTGYKLTLPFVFNDFNVDIRDTVPGLFSEGLYQNLFEYAQGTVQIIADSVAIHTDKDIVVRAEAHILDENYLPVGISAHSDNVLSSERDDNQIVIRIPKVDHEKMRNAHHLAFVFNLTGRGAISIRDYIHIQKIRITSDDGIYFTF